jgi:hypothetical protein
VIPGFERLIVHDTRNETLHVDLPLDIVVRDGSIVSVALRAETITILGTGVNGSEVRTLTLEQLRRVEEIEPDATS